ncbi:MAG: hypothetical protein AB7I33_01635 [Gemmatimonadales bacterium]
MLRSILGFAILAVLAFFGLNLIFSFFGIIVGLAVKILIWAVIGFGIYLVIKMFSPSTASKVKETVTGKSE